MKISSFMDSVKSPELAKRFSDKVPTIVNEMMERLDNFVRSEVAYASTELPKGETGETHRRVSLPFNGRDARPFWNICPMESRRDDYRNNYKGRDGYCANRARDDRAPYPSTMGEYNRRVAPVLTLNSLTKYPKEILATETQLRLPAPRPMINPLRSGNIDRYFNYHQEKGHYMNDCIQLRKQLEMALESGKLNHLVKDVRQRRRGSHGRDDPQLAKIINVISVNSVKDKKQKVREATESWINVLISFPAIPSDDISEEPLIVEAEVEGYLVRRVYVHEGPSVEVMFKHCFKNLNLKIKARLRETQTDLLGFTGEVSKPLGGLSDVVRDQLKCLLKDNLGIFAWDPSDMTGVPRQIIEHALNVNPSLDPADGTWRMCIDFKNLNSACLKDYYPLPNIDCKTESVMGFKYKCFLDAYKGYHQIQMAEENKEKTASYIDQGTYCYTKIPFGLRNTGATYQRLVDSTFQSQIGRNLKAYMDDMVIKSRDEKMLLADISETFDNLKKINMKLNPKKCSFGVEEGKFLGYMVTSEGIRANLRKTRALADLQSP
ncbi:reverse transcriptase domain-containing protein [Tanacetum coccineum]|uniref:Reverse transcriptase domain-containing protein n=1 Tax=Tanacetum coccineum TaxID=301880 RepID=A0ABQ4YH07_9ASTR